MISRNPSRYSTALGLVLAAGCAGNEKNLGDEQPAINATSEIDLADNPLARSVLPGIRGAAELVSDQQLYLAPLSEAVEQIFSDTFQRRGFADYDELPRAQAQALKSYYNQIGPEDQALLLKAIEYSYPLGADFDQLRTYLFVFEQEKAWEDSALVQRLLNSTFSGRAEASVAVVDGYAEVTFDYQVRPWQHPLDAQYYHLTIDLQAEILSDGDVRHRDGWTSEIFVSPDPTIIWSSANKMLVPVPAKGEVLELTVSMSYLSVTDRADYMEGHEEPELVSSVRLVRVPGASSDREGRELLVVEDLELRAPLSALVAGMQNTDWWAGWQRKPVAGAEHLDKMWLGKPLLRVGLDAGYRIENSWTPAKKGNQFGGPAFVEIFQMSCLPCLENMPKLAELNREYPALAVLALCNPDDANGIENITGPPMAVLDNKSFNRVGVQQFPTKMLLDSEGVVRWIGVGPTMPGEKLVNTLLEASLDSQ